MLLKLVFVFILTGSGLSNGPDKLEMTVLYESKCPDSVSFIVRQLQPAMDLLHDQIKLNLVPFGKAKSINRGYGGFQCQHGPSECQGNVVQDCALDLMSDRSDLEKVDYVVCEMSSFAASQGNPMCLMRSNISTDAVNKCTSSGRGAALQLVSEQITNHYRPRFIPTVIINGVFNQQIQDMALADLTGTLCTLLKGAGKCSQYNNNVGVLV